MDFRPPGSSRCHHLVVSKQEIETAARALVAKLEEIEKDKSYQGIWSFLLAHGMHYDGPNWAEELINLRKALA